jgi:aminomethyltransferase
LVAVPSRPFLRFLLFNFDPIARITGKNAIDFMESLTVADLKGAKEYAAQLSVFTNDQGGIRDDTVITRLPNKELYVVSNAGCSDKITELLSAAEKSAKAKGLDVNVRFLSEKSLVALQGTIEQ